MHRILFQLGLRADSLYAVDYASRVASEVGADMVKVNFPRAQKRQGVRLEYDQDFTDQEAIERVVHSANRSPLLVSGAEKLGDEALLEKAELSMAAGATGLIFGRNVWQRTHLESIRFVTELRSILECYPAPAKTSEPTQPQVHYLRTREFAGVSLD